MNRSDSISKVLLLVVVPALVALVVTLGMLRIWEGRQAEDVYILPTDSPTSLAISESGNDEGEPAATAAEAGEPCDNPVHTVEAGQTAGTIAESYGVTLDELIEINQIVDPNFNADFISVQQSIIIPQCGIPTATPAPEPTATERATSAAPIPTTTNPPAGTIDVRIDRVIGVGDITEEAVEISNQGSPVNLSGWILTDGDEEYEFPGFSLFTGGAVTVHTGVGTNDPRSLYWGLTEALWSEGTTVELYNAAGELVSSFTIEP